MKQLVVVALVCLTAAFSFGAEQTKIVSNPRAVPFARDPDFQIRKTKLTFIDPTRPSAASGRRVAFSRNAESDASIGFESSYRLFGAITELDRRQRYGHYMDFFWRTKRDAPVTVRLEYRQERLRGFTQAREVSYPRSRGSHKTEFQIIGDDYLNDGKITAWRCLLISEGRAVAEERSYLWE